MKRARSRSPAAGARAACSAGRQGSVPRGRGGWRPDTPMRRSGRGSDPAGGSRYGRGVYVTRAAARPSLADEVLLAPRRGRRRGRPPRPTRSTSATARALRCHGLAASSRDWDSASMRPDAASDGPPRARCRRSTSMSPGCRRITSSVGAVCSTSRSGAHGRRHGPRLRAPRNAMVIGNSALCARLTMRRDDRPRHSFDDSLAGRASGARRRRLLDARAETSDRVTRLAVWHASTLPRA